MWEYLVVFLFIFSNNGIYGQIGRSCTTPNGEVATCISIYSCTILYNAVSTKNQRQLTFLRSSQCGYQNNPLVCCGTKDNFETPITRTSSNSLLPDRSKCGIQSTNRILSGEATQLDEFPWMALLEYHNYNTGRRRFSCGGTLISSRYVLTAAHCVKGAVLRVVGNLVNVRLGEWNTDLNPDCLTREGFEVCSDPPLNRGVEKITPHPQYDENYANRYYDIALVRLNQDVVFTDYIKPICLAGPNDDSSVGQTLIVAGWGKTEKLSRSPVKLKVGVPIAERSNCERKYEEARIELNESQICAGGVKDKDSCTGDSGGPLMRTTGNDSSQWYIEGIVSFGAQCGTEGFPAVYTRVNQYIDWIHSTVY